MVTKTSLGSTPATLNVARVVTLQTAFDFGAIDFTETQVIAKEHTQKAYTTKKGVQKPAKLVPARLTGMRYAPLTVKELQTINPNMTASAARGARGSEMITAAASVIDDLAALKGNIALFGMTKKTNGHFIVDFGPIPDGAAKVTVESALDFIAKNPTHPAVVAYIAQLAQAK